MTATHAQETRIQGTTATQEPSAAQIRALFVIVSLIGGGAEHVVLRILEGAGAWGICAELAVLDGRGPLAERVPTPVVVHDLGKRSRLDVITATHNLRQVIAQFQPNVVVSFLPLANVIAWLATRVPRIPLVVNERTNTEANLHFERLGRLWRHLLPPIYRRASRVIANTEVAARFLADYMRIDRDRLCVFPNPLDPAAILRLTAEPAPHPWFEAGQAPVLVGMGRLSPEKGFALLIEAFALVQPRVRSRLVLIGEGSERIRLQQSSKRLGVTDQVLFMGYQKNPYPFLARSCALAIPSEFEGFPNVAVEAMVCGTPVIGFGGVGGLDEVSDHGRAALLVKPRTRAALAEALHRVLIDDSLHSALVSRGKLRAERYHPIHVLPAYFAILRDTANS